ncbi:MAG: peptidoglycan DD-metalloendopeptidase family protein [Saprospiraceae bacterium]|nr:peptidoglycan DD-metalloendopeptidase family protein [Saprospiraceae bacterium]HMW37838.1 peptidoglycan DD-metalloendopeptidase family protein [Saprospiraceae bacterium]HMX87524.1 peptidoglycan DD-metalloendopeptidase family protein [Saprospiraceae bacterium]HMZ39598.1 peptidoglycan DD-metalloendopeptidase family protein [Saprospiraceae bacterium]HNA63950.1 peptidoglycan DD-metalloendopeptidase family protein [Saprospiraceae bacterium]
MKKRIFQKTAVNPVLISLVASIVFSFIANEPSNKERIKFLKAQIRETESVLKQLEKDKKNFVTQIRVRRGLIEQRNDLIKNIRNEVEALSKKLEELESTNKLALDTLSELRATYTEIACQKNRSRFLKPLSLESVNGAWSLDIKRNLWKEQIIRYRIGQFIRYKKSQEVILSKQNDIKQKINEKRELLNTEQSEMDKMNTDIADLEKNYEHISSKSKEYQQLVISYNKEQKSLEEIVNKSILADKTNSKGSAVINRSIWNLPVKEGIVITRFGLLKDHHNPEITLRNNGIDIRSSESFVRAVSNGKVVQIRQLPSGSFVVLTKAGNLYVVYSNLDKVFVKEAENIAAGNNLGELKLNPFGSYDLHFEVWEGKSAVDPMHYIRLN